LWHFFLKILWPHSFLLFQSVSAFPPSALTLWCLFLLELILNSLCKAGYFLSFFFWVDLVSAFSLVQEIPWIWAPMFGLNASDSYNTSNDVTNTPFQVDRIRRISSSASKFVRLLKFLKLVRLGRIAKLFDMAQRTLEERHRRQRREARVDENTIHAEDYTEDSQVGNALSEETTRKVVLLVLVMMLGIPLLETTNTDRAEEFVVGELNDMASEQSLLGTVFAVHNSDNSYTAVPANETADARAQGQTLIPFLPSDLAALLLNYDTALGQPYRTGDPYHTQSPQHNRTYVTQVVGTAKLSVALLALQQAGDGMQSQFDWTLSNFGTNVLYLHVRGAYWSNDYASPGLFNTRINEMTAAEDGDGPGGKTFGIFSIHDDAYLAAEYSIFRTLTVLILLSVGASAFQRNHRKMVIEPIERMVATIVQLQKNPLAKALLEAKEDGGASGEAAAHAERSGAGSGGWCGWLLDRCCSIHRGEAVRESSSNPSTETVMLERTLEKLTGLVQIGFGEAGSRMIEKCMNSNADGDLDPLVDGTRLLAIFGFCDIRRFTDATECLKEEVMMYVNEIANIVHTHCSELEGHPNKNVGDAFLVIWRLKRQWRHGLKQLKTESWGISLSNCHVACLSLHAAFHTPLDPDDLFQINEKQPQYLREPMTTLHKRKHLATQAERDYAADELRSRMERMRHQRAKQASASVPPIVRPIHPLTLVQLSVQADKAVVAFLRVIVSLDASPTLRAYEQHPAIEAAFGRGNFAVQLGFGLHCGWAIEGPIGSRYKIDASYLSAHVNLSEALQDLTKEYGTPLLVSGEFYTLLSPYLKSFMRRIDVVRVVGRDVPLNLYAFDIHADALKTVVAKQCPSDYDRDAEIEVYELKASFFNKVRMGNTHNDDVDEDEEDDSPLGSPMSPGPVHHVHDVLDAHQLFLNPYLNPHAMPFDSYNYGGNTRRIIHASSPIAEHHLVYNFRLQVLQCGIPYAFQDIYAAGLEHYLDGRWSDARAQMEEALRLYPGDKPAQVILGVMAKHDYVAPPDWAGWHDA
jgi:class 3 adenylate cyclase